MTLAGEGRPGPAGNIEERRVSTTSWALKFLQMAVRHEVESAVAEFGGVSEVLGKCLREHDSPTPIRIRICDMESENLGSYVFENQQSIAFDCEVAIDAQSNGQQLKVESECFTTAIGKIESRRIAHKVAVEKNRRTYKRVTSPVFGQRHSKLTLALMRTIDRSFLIDIKSVLLRIRTLNQGFCHVLAATDQHTYCVIR